MDTKTNPLIGETAADTINNVSEALNGLLKLLVHGHSDLCRLMEPIAHALEHAPDQQQ